MGNRQSSAGRVAVPQVFAARPARRGEQGYVLLAVVFLSVAILIALSVAAPKVAADIERDREVELMHRAQQYVRAVKLYYKKFGAYPPNLDALEKTNQIRFLRKRYKDPATGKDEWHLIHFGENKTPSYGFFGQPVGGAGGAALTGLAPNGGQNPGGLFSNNGNAGSNSIFSQTPTGTDPNSTGTAASGATAQSGSGGIAAGASSTDPNSGAGNASGFGTAGNASNLTVGGLGIIGVESTSPKPTILEWHKKKHFNEWEFFYDPNADRMTVSSNLGAIGQPAGSNGGIGGGASGFGNNNGIGNSNGVFGGQNGGSPPPPPPQNPQ